MFTRQSQHFRIAHAVNVVQSVESAFQRFFCRFKMIGVNAEPRGKRRFFSAFHIVEHGGKTILLLCRGNGGGVGTRRFRADIDKSDVAAFPFVDVFNESVDFIVFAAVGKRIGRHVQNAHNHRTVRFRIQMFGRDGFEKRQRVKDERPFQALFVRHGQFRRVDVFAVVFDNVQINRSGRPAFVNAPPHVPFDFLQVAQQGKGVFVCFDLKNAVQIGFVPIVPRRIKQQGGGRFIQRRHTRNGADFF